MRVPALRKNKFKISPGGETSWKLTPQASPQLKDTHTHKHTQVKTLAFIRLPDRMVSHDQSVCWCYRVKGRVWSVHNMKQR